MAPDKIFTRSYVLTFSAVFSFAFSFFSLVPTLPIYLQGLGLKEEQIGILVGIFSIPSLLLRPAIARLIPGISAKKFLIGGATISAISTLALLWVQPFWPFLILRLLQGIGLGCFFTAGSILIINISPEVRLGQSISFFYLSMNIPFAIAPSVGRWPRCRTNGDHTLHVEPDLGEDPSWVCENCSAIVAAVGEL